MPMKLLNVFGGEEKSNYKLEIPTPSSNSRWQCCILQNIRVDKMYFFLLSRGFSCSFVK